MPIETTTNPLDEAGTAPSLDKFYDKEPDELTDAEIEELIAAHRAERDRWQAAEEAKADKARKKAAKGPAKPRKPRTVKAPEPAEGPTPEELVEAALAEEKAA